jgi:hypothetical protein
MQYYHTYQELQRITREQEQNVAPVAGTPAQNIDLAFICNVECLWPFYL